MCALVCVRACMMKFHCFDWFHSNVSSATLYQIIEHTIYGVILFSVIFGYFECDDWIYVNERGSLLKLAEFAIESRQQSIIILNGFFSVAGYTTFCPHFRFVCE